MGLRPGGLPWPPIVAWTLWMYSAMATESALDEGQRRIVLADCLTDELAVLVGERDSRSKEVRALRTTAKIGGMAAGAVAFVERFAPDQNVRRRQFARVLCEATAPASTALTAALLAGTALASRTSSFGRRRSLRGRSLTLGRRRSGALREQQAGGANGGDGNGGDQADIHSHDVKDPPTRFDRS